MQELPQILKDVLAAGHLIFDTGDYDINLIGVRNPNGQPDKYDDILFDAVLKPIKEKMMPSAKK